MGAKESKRIHDRLSGLVPGREFMIRVNAGQAWAGLMVNKTPNFITLKNPRVFHGVPEGVSDMLGFEVVEITAEMVGDKVAVFVAEEVKVTGRLSKAQRAFGDFVERHGGFFRVLR